MLINRPCKICKVKQAVKDRLCIDCVQTVSVYRPKPKARPRKRKNKYVSDYPLKNCQRWKKLSRTFLAENPHCSACLSLRTPQYIFAAHVDHIKPVRKYLELAYDVSNLQSLCASCHSIKSANEARGVYVDYRNHDIDKVVIFIEKDNVNTNERKKLNSMAVKNR